MVQVIFSFDTEDYVSPFSDDSILRLSEILKSDNIVGCFNMVAELSDVLIKRGRNDVIKSLESHEIDYHSARHTWHPTVVEYTDKENWDEGYGRFISEERQGIKTVKDIFKRDKLYASVPPGNCISAQAIYGYSELGTDIYSGSLFKNTKGKGVWFCNLLNLENNCYVDSLLLEKGIRGIMENINEWENWERLIMCCHPNIINHEQFWDALNMKGENLVKWGEWIIPPSRPDEKKERFFEDFKKTIHILKENGNFEFTTYGAISDRQKKKGHRIITCEMLLNFLKRIKENFFYVEHFGDSYSLADIFKATIHFLCQKQDGYKVENSIGPLYEPLGAEYNITVCAEKIREAANKLFGEKIIPHAIHMDTIVLGPRDFLEAAAQLLEGKESIQISKKPQLPDINMFYRMNDFSLANTWMYPESFKDEWVTKRLKWQSWTIRSEC